MAKNDVLDLDPPDFVTLDVCSHVRLPNVAGLWNIVSCSRFTFENSPFFEAFDPKADSPAAYAQRIAKNRAQFEKEQLARENYVVQCLVEQLRTPEIYPEGPKELDEQEETWHCEYQKYFDLQAVLQYVQTSWSTLKDRGKMSIYLRDIHAKVQSFPKAPPKILAPKRAATSPQKVQQPLGRITVADALGAREQRI